MVDALALQPNDPACHPVKGMVLSARREWRSAIAEAETAIAEDRNNARAYADIGFWSIFIGRSEDGFADIERAFQDVIRCNARQDQPFRRSRT